LCEQSLPDHPIKLILSLQPAVQASPHLTLKAVYSRSSKSAKELANHVPGVDVYSDDSAAGYDDLLKRSDIHAIIIACVHHIIPSS
jgi:predicted dehydrogenase